MIDWIKIKEVSSSFTSQNIIALLADNGIEASEINKTDSSFMSAFGKVEIYCHPQNAEKALQLIEENNF